MQLEAKHSAASQPFLRPDLAAIGFDDRAGDRQSEAGALRLGCKERVENSLQLVGWNAGTGIENRYLDVSVPGQHGFQRQSSRAWIAARHCIHSIHCQIQDDLLQVHHGGAHGQGGLCLTYAWHNASRHCLMVKKVKRTPNCVIQVELLQLDFTSLPQQTTQLLDDFCCPLIIPANVGDSLLELIHVKWISREEDLRGLRVA